MIDRHYSRRALSRYRSSPSGPAPLSALLAQLRRCHALAILVLLLMLAAGPLQAAPHPDGRSALLKAYPAHLQSIEGNMVVWADGTTMSYDDGRSSKSFDELLDQPDLEDQMSMLYPAGSAAIDPPPRDFDPGRVRYEPFFRKMYGSSRREVEANLATVRWLRTTVDVPVRITRINGVAGQLQKVSDELEKLPRPLQRYVQRISGSYFWRPIAGTDRLSMHSFGIAIDIDARYADYWMWDRPGPGGTYLYRNHIPREIVDIFEKHGFIWGGAWYHYDTMHFEFRPELLLRASGQ